jgi:hypothetical protein
MNISALRAPIETLGDATPGLVQPQLSTDYLNRFGEALMLIEMAPLDRSILDELKGWSVIGYVAHFEQSQLRCRAAAIAGYAHLSAPRREAFDELCATMNTLIAQATETLDATSDADDLSLSASLAAGRLRALISQATQFINANGTLDPDVFEGVGLQDDIDAMFA